MKRPPSRHSADGKWWWDGEQWQPVDASRLPVQQEEPKTALVPRAPRTWPKPKPPPRHQIMAMALTLAAIVLAFGLPPPEALPMPSLHLPSVRLPSVHLPLPAATPRPSPTHAPSPSPSAHPSKPATPPPNRRVDAYRAAATAGGVQLRARIDEVDRGCTAPANLAVCRAALIALQREIAQTRVQLDAIGSPPPCLSAADGALHRVLDDLDSAAAGTVAAIDAGDPGRIVSGVQAVDQGRPPLDSALQQVQTGAC